MKSRAIYRLAHLLLPALMLLAGATPLRATHIVGAELTYACLDSLSNTYNFRLRLLRDCLLGEAPFDDIIYLYAFSSANPSNYRIFQIPKPPVTPEIIPTQWSQCVGTPYNLCTEEGIYQATITIPPILGGWDFAWARCCRNNNIDNLFQPLNQGVTFLAHMPGPELAACNSMPVYDNQLPTFICVDEDFYFDHSATDPDGDSLVYSLTRPYTGVNVFNVGAGNPQFGGPQPAISPTNPMGPPPYANVTYNGPTYNDQNPFGPNSASIDPQSGLLRVHAPATGVYVIAISVFEYRNGNLLSENKKDLQIHVINCLPQNDPPLISHVFLPTDSVRGDTIVIEALDTTCYTVTLSDPNNNQLEIRPVSAIFTGADAPSLSITGTNPVNVEVCWDSDCDFAGSTVELILMGYDLTNCPVYNPVFDTIYIQIDPPLSGRPGVGHLLPPNNPGGPDTLYAAVGQPGCFDLWVTDTVGIGGSESYTLLVEALDGGAASGVSVSVDASDPDSLALQGCWTASCGDQGRYFRVILTGRLDDVCPPFNTRQDTLYLYVPPLPNPPPVVRPDISMVPQTLGDTLYIEVHNDLCFQFTVRDTFPAVGLSQTVTLSQVGGAPAGGLPPTVTTTVDDSLIVDVCWYPTCANVDGLFQIVLTGTQDNNCGLSAANADTLYIRVRDAVNPPPVLTADTLPGYVYDGDTLVLTPDSLGCFAFSLRDTGANSYLVITAEVLLLADGSPTGQPVAISYTTQTDTLLAGTICFTPGCDYLDQRLLVALTGRDTFDCYPSNWVHDTIPVRVIQPFNRPPTISHNLNGLPVTGNTVVVTPQAQPFCYIVQLDDPDSTYADLTAEGASYVFDAWFRYGNPGEVTLSGTNPLIINVCWAPSCYDSGERFDLVICGRDTSRCGLTPQVCDTVSFQIEDCSIEVQNVFSPNGDGINDAFVPYYNEGVQFYRMSIYDRWGKEVYQGQDGTWDGTLRGDGKAVPEGVYYYVFDYQFFSARGVPLKERLVGWVTLLR
jgi:gliding motility-associated-like protein